MPIRSDTSVVSVVDWLSTAAGLGIVLISGEQIRVDTPYMVIGGGGTTLCGADQDGAVSSSLRDASFRGFAVCDDI